LISYILKDQKRRQSTTKALENHDGEEIRGVLKTDRDSVRGHLEEFVRSAVAETLNQLLDNAEADQRCGAKRDERSVEGMDTCAGLRESFFLPITQQRCPHDPV